MKLIFLQKNEISGIAFEKKSLLAKYGVIKLIQTVIASP
jgi:hypothetical protein